MKKLFFLLLVVNLVIWLWGEREQLGRVTQTAPPDVGVIRLLDQPEVDARREQAKREAEAPPVAAMERADDAGQPSSPSVLVGTTADGDRGIVGVEGPAPEPPATDSTGHPPDESPHAPSTSPPAPPAAPTVAQAADAVSGESETPPGSAGVTTPTGETLVATIAPHTAEFPPTVDAAGAAVGDAPRMLSDSSVPAAPPSDATPPVALASATASEGSAGNLTAEPEPASPGPAAADAAVPAPAVAVPGVTTPDIAVTLGPPAAAIDGESSQEAVPPVTSSVDAMPVGRTASGAPSLHESAPAPEASAEVIAPRVDAHPVPAEPVAPPTEPSAVPYVCESIGPFAERPAAVQIQAVMTAPLRGVTIREQRASRPVRHWVVAPVQSSKEATAEYLTSLGQAGVKDAWRIPSGPLAGRLAVGVFQSAENARKHADMLAAKGVPAEVHAPTTLEPARAYWVDYERPADAPPPDAGAGRGKPARQIVARSCGRVAGSGALP